MYKYFYWHYTKGTKRYLEIWKDYVHFLWRFFSVRLLLKTLFWPWKRDITLRQASGFDFQEFLQRLAFNLISRMMGAIVRFLTIIIGFLVELLVIVGGAVFFLVWLALPIVVLVFLVAGIKLIFSASFLQVLVMFFMAGIFLFLPAILYAIGKKKLPSEMTLEEMMRQPWFELVWTRIGAENPPGGGSLDEFLKQHDTSREEFEHIAAWVARQYEERERARMFWLKENLAAVRGLGIAWAYGYSNNLDKVSKDVSVLKPEEKFLHLIGRKKEVDALERVLARAEENNVLVVGEPGVGKKTVVREFAEQIYNGEVLPVLRYKRVLELDMGAVLAGAKNASEMEARLRLVLNEAVLAGNIILLINNIHNFVGQQTGVGKVDISGALMPYLGSKDIQIIGITTYDGLHKKIESQPGLMKYFEKVEVKELEADRILMILEDLIPLLEKRVDIRISYKALQEVISKSGLYFADVAMPERAVDLIDEALIFVATKTQDKIVLPRHIDTIISEKAEIPVGELSEGEKEKLVKLEDILHQRVVNQEEAVKSVASAMRRARMGVGEKKRPIGSFLFLGPTGVGKTETAKTLAAAYFGNEDRMIRLDMSEYQNISDINRLIGTPGGELGHLTTAVRENPFSLILFDEIEKAHPNILNLFLQVLDEGWLTDASGRKVNFRNAIIIATSNAGAEFIRQMVSEGISPAQEEERLLDHLQANNIFRPEFINRFDGVIIFHPLTHEHLVKIAGLLLQELNDRLVEQKIGLVITPALCERVARLGYDPEYGARPMRRVIQDKIEDLISQKLLDGSLKKGESIEVKPEEI